MQATLVTSSISASPRSIGLSSKENPSKPKTIKLCKAGFHTGPIRLVYTPMPADALQKSTIREGWLSRDVQNENESITSLHEAERHSWGWNYTREDAPWPGRFPDPITAIHSCKRLPHLYEPRINIQQCQFRPCLPDKL